MWIHVPETYSQSVAASGESSLDSEALSLLALSATWKTKHRLVRFWRRELEMGALTMLRSGLTSEPSIQNRGVERWISWLGASHASHIPKLERNFTAMTKESFQERSSESPTGLDFQFSFSKMFQASSDSTGTTYDPNYENWVTHKLRKDSSRRQKQAHLTGENDYSSWPTPQTDESGRSPEAWEQARQAKALSGVNLQKSLKVEAVNWPTPDASTRGNRAADLIVEGKNQVRRRESGQQRGIDLETATANWPTPTGTERSGTNPATGKGEGLNKTAKNWPTPNTRDYKGFDSPGKENTHQNPEMYLSIHQGPTTTQDGSGSSPDGPNSPPPTAKKDTMCSPKCRRLSPLFCEVLMGLPLGWTDDSGPLATVSFQSWRLGVIENLRSS